MWSRQFASAGLCFALAVLPSAIATRSHAAVVFAARAASPDVYYATVGGGGSLSAWTLTSARAATLNESWWCSAAGYVYQVGGGTTSTLYSAQILGTGLAAWSTLANLNAPLYNPCTVTDASESYLYRVAGSVAGWGSPTTSVESAPVTAGVVGAWTSQAPYPMAVFEHAAASDGSYVFAIAGVNASSFSVSAVYSAPIAGGVLAGWTSVTPLPQAICCAQSFACAGYVYVLGGEENSNSLATVWSAAILSGGFLGSWASTTAIPVGVEECGIAVTGGYVYLIGGRWTTGNTSAVYSAQILGGGALGSWNSEPSLPFSDWELTGGPVDICPAPGTPTPSGTRTLSATRSPTATASPVLPTATRTATASRTHTVSPSGSRTPTPTGTAAPSPTASATQTAPSVTVTCTVSRTETRRFTKTPTASATVPPGEAGVLPNPLSGNSATFWFEAPHAGTIILRVWTYSGLAAAAAERRVDRAGRFSFEVELAGLAGGVYFFQISMGDGGAVAASRVLKLLVKRHDR